MKIETIASQAWQSIKETSKKFFDHTATFARSPAGKFTAIAFLLALTPYALHADSGSLWNIAGDNSALAGVGKKTEQVGLLAIRIVRALLLGFLIWRVVMFIKERKVIDIVWVLVASLLIGYAPQLINAFYSFGESN